MMKDMSSRNRPKFNTDSRLTPNGGGPAGKRPGSAPEGTARRPPRSSTAALRRFFALGTPASAAAAPAGSGGLPAAAAGELAALLDRPGRAGGGVAVELAAAAPAAGVDTEASNRPGTAARRDVEPDAQPAGRGHRRARRRVDVPADVARANPFTPPPAGTAATWR